MKTVLSFSRTLLHNFFATAGFDGFLGFAEALAVAFSPLIERLHPIYLPIKNGHENARGHSLNES